MAFFSSYRHCKTKGITLPKNKEIGINSKNFSHIFLFFQFLPHSCRIFLSAFRLYSLKVNLLLLTLASQPTDETQENDSHAKQTWLPDL